MIMLAFVEPLTVVLFFIAVLIAAVLFCMWVVSILFRFARNLMVWVWRAAFGMSVEPARERLAACVNDKCGAMNPQVARFCRRCGQPMSGVMRVVSTRAAG